MRICWSDWTPPNASQNTDGARGAEMLEIERPTLTGPLTAGLLEPPSAGRRTSTTQSVDATSVNCGAGRPRLRFQT